MTGPFSPGADLYDVVYGHLDYAGHAAAVEGVIRDRNPGASSLLDVACGTGRHLELWRDRFDRRAGLDVDEDMLALARRRLDGVALHRGDFTSFNLGERFDAVTCLFSSIGYADTPERLDAAVASMARHLAPGGVLVVEPWLAPDRVEPPWVRYQVVEEDERIVVRTSRMRYYVAGGVTDLEFTYLVTTPEGSTTFTQRHVMGVYTPGRYLEAAEKAGLSAEFDPEGTDLGRGLLVGVAAGARPGP